MNTWRIVKIIKIVLLVTAGIGLFGFATMKLWNWLMPELFGLKEISFIQTLGLLLLSKIIFGFKHGGPGHPAKERWKRNFFRRSWEKKLANLSPEERDKLKNEYRKRWSGWCDEDESKTQNSST